MQEVSGSIPLGSTIQTRRFATGLNAKRPRATAKKRGAAGESTGRSGKSPNTTQA